MNTSESIQKVTGKAGKHEPNKAVQIRENYYSTATHGKSHVASENKAFLLKQSCRSNLFDYLCGLMWSHCGIG